MNMSFTVIAGLSVTYNFLQIVEESVQENSSLTCGNDLLRE